MPGQLENSKNSHQSDNTKNGQRHGLVVALLVRRHGGLRRYHLLLLGHDGGQGDEVGYDSDQVDHVHNVFGEDVLRRAGEEPDEKLEGEPDDAQCLDDEERVRHVRNFVLLDFGSVCRRVKHLVVLELGKCL